MKSSFIATLVGAVFVAADCPTAGLPDSQGRYSCNPSHQYRNDQVCGQIGGCYYLFGANGKLENNGSSAKSIQTAATCLAAGSTDSQGRISCNPAYEYLNGQTCNMINGCFYLSSGGKPITNNSTTGQPSIVTAGASSLQATGALIMAAFALFLLTP